jgi:hypothetical protein
LELMSVRAPSGRRSRRGTSPSAWLPAAVLALGLIALAIAVVGSGDVSDSIVKQASTDPRWPIAGGIDILITKFFSPFKDDRLRILTVLMAIVYFGSVAALGNTIVSALRGHARWPRPVSWLAGFLPGYLMVLGPLQLLFAAVPYVTAAWLALVGVPVGAVLVHRRTIVTGITQLRSVGGRRRYPGLAALAVASLVLLALVHRLQASGYFLGQDSIGWFLVAASDQLGLGAHGVFPLGRSHHYLSQWDQQSDEWLFSAPLMFSSHASRDFGFPMYAAQAMSLVSVSCLVFGLVHRFAERRKVFAASVAVVTVLSSSASIYLWRYLVVITGDNPILWTGHTGRHVGIVAPWIAVALLGRQRRSVVVASALATLGLGFTSLQVLTWVLVAVGAALLLRAVHGRDRPRVRPSVVRWLVQCVPLVVLGMIVLAFWWVHHAQAPAAGAWWLVAAAAVALATTVVIMANAPSPERPRLPRGAPAWFMVWIATIVTGLLLSNNMSQQLFHGDVRGLLGTVLPGYDIPLLTRADLPNNLLDGLSFPRLAGENCTLLLCQSFAGFLASYGVLIVVCLAAWFAVGSTTPDPAVATRRAVWLLLVAGLAISFVIIDFTGAISSAQVIIFTRFIEVPYYSLLAFAAMAFATSRHRATVIGGTGVLLVWAVVPAVVGQWPQQMASNAWWLLHHAR